MRTLQSIPPWWESFREALYDEMGDPATDAERHRAISPLFHADNIVRPMLVIQGANDPRVLQVESDELVEAARANGATVEYVVFPDEGHGFLRRENRITASNAYVNFLDINHVFGTVTGEGRAQAIRHNQSWIDQLQEETSEVIAKQCERAGRPATLLPAR